LIFFFLTWHENTVVYENVDMHTKINAHHQFSAILPGININHGVLLLLL